MQIKLDFRSGIPIYIQIMDQVKHLVATGQLRPDDQLPTVRHLAAELRVNFNTIARAYRLLDEAGIISTQQGRGTYILEPHSQENSDRLRRQALEGLSRRYLAQAARLGYDPDQISAILADHLTVWREQGSPPTAEFED